MRNTQEAGEKINIFINRSALTNDETAENQIVVKKKNPADKGTHLD